MLDPIFIVYSMLPEQKDLMYKHFPQLVEKCDLEHILHELIEKDELSKEILNEISLVSLLVLIFNQLDFASITPCRRTISVTTTGAFSSN